MRIFSRISAALDRINTKLKYLVAFYVVLFLSWTLVYWQIGYKAYAPQADGLAADLFRSIGSNLVFFGVFGLAALVPTLVRPSDEPIERRLSFLITSKNVSREALDYIRSEVVRLCGYMQESRLELRIREFLPERRAMKIEHRARAVARNTFQAEDYVDPDFTVHVSPDPVQVEGQLGEITLAEFVRDGVEESLIETPLALHSGLFSKTVPLRIKRDSTTLYRLHCWLWCTVDEPYFVHNHRYIDLMVIDVINDTGDRLRLRNEIEGEGRDEFTLDPGGRRELLRAPLQPGRRPAVSIVTEPSPLRSET